MSGTTDDPCRSPGSARVCARHGCGNTVKKPTNKYCSVNCCAVDPERHQRLRAQAQRNSRRTMLPLAQQLTLAKLLSPVNPEAQIALIGEGREDIPQGMSRLAG